MPVWLSQPFFGDQRSVSVWLVLFQHFFGGGADGVGGGSKKYVGVISSTPSDVGVQISFFPSFLYLFLWSRESTFLWSADSKGVIVSPSDDRWQNMGNWWDDKWQQKTLVLGAESCQNAFLCTPNPKRTPLSALRSLFIGWATVSFWLRVKRQHLNNMWEQLDATIIIYWYSINSTCFGQFCLCIFRSARAAPSTLYTVCASALGTTPRQHNWVQKTKSCKPRSSDRLGQKMARNMLS
jgi:hypothetical protein